MEHLRERVTTALPTRTGSRGALTPAEEEYEWLT
jgi:hypothetical protein